MKPACQILNKLMCTGPERRRLVRKERLVLSRVTPLEPKSSASTSSATFARPGSGARGPRARGADYSQTDRAGPKAVGYPGRFGYAAGRAREGHKMGQVGNLIVVAVLTVGSGL